MDMANNIKKLREQHNISQAELAQIAGVSNKAVSTWETGRNEPRMGALQKIADYFDIRKSDIIESEPLPSNLHRVKPIRKVPIVGRIACGLPILAEENINGYTYLPEGISADFALECQGDSMIDANIFDGDLVYIRLQPEVENGEIAAVRIGEEATLKKVYYQKGSVMLMAANSEYPPQMYTNEQLNDVHIIGKMKALLRTFD